MKSSHVDSSGFELVFNCRSEVETARFGHALADILQPGAVVALNGPLGAGKTRLVQAIAEALGADRADVTSPTFTLLQEYEARLPIYHFDTYRLRDSDEFLQLGADELLEADGVCVIEWAARVDDALPADVLSIAIEPTGPESREFRIGARGTKSAAMLSALRAGLEEPHRNPG